MATPYPAKAIANYFLDRRSDRKIRPVTQMKLHKIAYFAHGWHLAIRRTPLLDEMVEAWEYGPVIPSLYHEFKEYGSREIPRNATDWNPRTEEYDIIPKVHSDDRFALSLLEKVFKVYGTMSAIQLSALTHEEGSPWTETIQKYPGIKNVDIPNDLIRVYFTAKAMRHREGQ
jgi:uncharacterized phage-associated protein